MLGEKVNEVLRGETVRVILKDRLKMDRCKGRGVINMLHSKMGSA